MTANPIVKKLGLKPGMRALFLAAPDGYAQRLAPLPEGVKAATRPAGTYQFIQFFATHMAEIEKTVPGLLQRAAPGACVLDYVSEKDLGHRQRSKPGHPRRRDDAQRMAPGFHCCAR